MPPMVIVEGHIRSPRSFGRSDLGALLDPVADVGPTCPDAPEPPYGSVIC